jgi:hypothetical protein
MHNSAHGVQPSAALLKAVLINGAQPIEGGDNDNGPDIQYDGLIFDKHGDVMLYNTSKSGWNGETYNNEGYIRYDIRRHGYRGGWIHDIDGVAWRYSVREGIWIKYTELGTQG